MSGRDGLDFKTNIQTHFIIFSKYVPTYSKAVREIVEVHCTSIARLKRTK